MIVDVHTHIPTHVDAVPLEDEKVYTAWRPDHAVRTTNSFDDYIEAMAPVDRTFAFGIARYSDDRETGSLGAGPQQRVNDTVAALAARYPDKVIGFRSVHPDDPNVIDEMERCVHDLGLRGVKLGPNYQNFEPLGEPAKRVYGYAQRHKLPIVFHQGPSPMRDAPIRYAHPLILAEIDINFPNIAKGGSVTPT